MDATPAIRIRTLVDAPINADGDYVLYWMVAFRRTESNFALQRAIELAQELKKPLVVFEPLRSGYRWACDRFHQFVIDGMADNAVRLAKKSVTYYPYLEPTPGAGRGLLETLSQKACAVASDDYPCFFLPKMAQFVANRISVPFELVDSNGILPMRAAEKVFSRAHDFRRFLQKTVRPHLDEFPRVDPFRGVRLPKLDSLPSKIMNRWPAVDPKELKRGAIDLSLFPIDHNVPIVEGVSGGAVAASKRLAWFLKSGLPKYESDRNQPEQEVTSGLSPHLHFGHISAHQIFAEVAAADGWNPGKVSEKVTGSAGSWWGASDEVESFFDELITWREVGFNMCWQRDDYDRYESLPQWAQTTLGEHAVDPRDALYTLEQFETATTHDPLWNAAQRQLVREGRIHNYLRMVWGKKILEWSPSPREALNVLIELNNKYALDGRDPNSYSGIFWCLGRYDRAWGPVRPVYGKIRYMSSENTARKVKVRNYIQTYGAD